MVENRWISARLPKHKRLDQISIILISFTLILVVVTVFSRCFANDTIARIGAGGITFMKAEDIRILEEVLGACRT